MGAAVVVAVVTGWSLLRVGEFLLSERNTGRLLAAGAIERCGAQHLPLILANVAVAFLALVGQSLPGGVGGPISLAALVVLLGAETVHWWTILTLASRWTTRVLVLPGESPRRAGPYRLLRHPGYVAGTVSGTLLPLVAGSWPGSVVAAGLLVAVVVPRVRCEDEAWRSIGTRCGRDGSRAETDDDGRASPRDGE